jgi:hypothetical protein
MPETAAPCQEHPRQSARRNSFSEPPGPLTGFSVSDNYHYLGKSCVTTRLRLVFDAANKRRSKTPGTVTLTLKMHSVAPGHGRVRARRCRLKPHGVPQRTLNLDRQLSATRYTEFAVYTRQVLLHSTYGNVQFSRNLTVSVTVCRQHSHAPFSVA